MSYLTTRLTRREIRQRRAKRAYARKKYDRWKKYVTDEENEFYKKITFLEKLGLTPSDEQLKELKRLEKISEVIDLSEKAGENTMVRKRETSEISRRGRPHKRQRDDYCYETSISHLSSASDGMKSDVTKSFSSRSEMPLNKQAFCHDGDNLKKTLSIESSIKNNNMYTNCIYIPANLSTLVSSCISPGKKELAYSKTTPEVTWNPTTTCKSHIQNGTSNECKDTQSSHLVYTVRCPVKAPDVTLTQKQEIKTNFQHSNTCLQTSDLDTIRNSFRSFGSSPSVFTTNVTLPSTSCSKTIDKTSEQIGRKDECVVQTTKCSKQGTERSLAQRIQWTLAGKNVNTALASGSVNSPISTLMLSDNQLTKVLPSFIRVASKNEEVSTMTSTKSALTTSINKTSISNVMRQKCPDINDKPSLSKLQLTHKNSQIQSACAIVSHFDKKVTCNGETLVMKGKTATEKKGARAGGLKMTGVSLKEECLNTVLNKGPGARNFNNNNFSDDDQKAKRKGRRKNERSIPSKRQAGKNALPSSKDNDECTIFHCSSLVNKGKVTKCNYTQGSPFKNFCDKSSQTEGSLTELLIAILNEKGRVTC